MAGWVYSDWDQETKGTTAYRQKLSLHIKEVSEHITNRNHSTQNKSHNADALAKYLDRLMAAQAEAGSIPVVDAPTPTGTSFVRLRPTRE